MVIQVDMNFLNSYVSMVKLKGSVMVNMSLMKMGMDVLNFDMNFPIISKVARAALFPIISKVARVVLVKLKGQDTLKLTT